MAENREKISSNESRRYEQTNNRQIKILIRLTTGESVRGCIDINKNSRTSDFLKTDRSLFLTMHSVETSDSESEILFVHKEHIVYVVPIAD
jgi:hypothetical protein